MQTLDLTNARTGEALTLPVDDAMREFSARGGAAEGWSLVPTSAPRPTAPAPVELTAEEVERRSAGGGDFGGTVHQQDRARAEASTARLRAMGYHPSETLVPVGMTLAMSGLSKWRRMHQAWSESPTVAEVAPALIERINAERGWSKTIPTEEIRLVEDGGRLLVARKGMESKAIALEPGGMRGLLTRAPHIMPTTTGGSWFDFDAAEMAWLWNTRITRCGVSQERIAELRAREGAATTDRERRHIRRQVQQLQSGGASQTLIRGRRDRETGTPTVWAANGAKFPADADIRAVLRMMQEESPEARIQATYNPDGRQLTWTLQDMSDIPPVVGEVYAAQGGGFTRDDGQGSYRNWDGLLRAQCLNLTTLFLATGADLITHTRHSARMMREIRKSLGRWQQATEAFDAFRVTAEKASEADAGRVICGEKGATVREVMQELARTATVRALMRPHVEGRGTAADAATVEALLRAADSEGLSPDSPASLYMASQALTRWARDRPDLVRVEAGAAQRKLLSLTAPR